MKHIFASVLRHTDCDLSTFARARMTLARMSEARAVQTNGFGFWLCFSMYCVIKLQQKIPLISTPSAVHRMGSTSHEAVNPFSGIRMTDPSLLWVDFRLTIERFSLFDDVCRRYRAIRVISPLFIAESIKRNHPDVVCFKFDYPSTHGLNALQQTLLRFPSLPVLMLTKQHSEDLAVWAFRSGVSDYVVTPVYLDDLFSNLDYLFEVAAKSAYVLQHRGRITPLPKDTVPVLNTKRRRTSNAIEFIADNFGNRITLKQASTLCHLSPSEFSRRFKQEHGVCFREYLTTVRISKAREYLQSPGMRVSDVAHAVGFEDLSYFDRVFKCRLGVCPSLYKVSMNE